jgi:hypothetical protein
MSNYYFKGTSITQITTNTNASQNQNYYENFPTQSTNYSGLIPLPLSYTDSSEDISNICTAASTTYNSSQNVYAPTGANNFRAISIGGGGGGGGAGGNATLNVNSTAEGSCPGKNGGTGGAGGIYYYDSTGAVNISGANLIITVGTGGNGGNQGANASGNIPALSNGYETASGGNSGNSGNSSYIQIGEATQIALANGGGGGNSGDGAEVIYNVPHGFNCSGSPSPGNTGNSGSGGNNTSLNFPAFNTGGGGGGGVVSGGSSGNSGSVQIIWLYD